MRAKTFEIRDAWTFIPALAVKLCPDTEDDRYLLARAGFGRTRAEQSQYIYLMRISGGVGTATSDPHEWISSRTMHEAHKYIEQHFDSLASGAVIDVQYILGETQQPKRSERFDVFGDLV